MQPAKMFEGIKKSATPGMTKTAVSGVGDDAIFVGAPNFSSLWVKKGTAFLLARIYGLPPGEAETKLKSLATSAVAKL